MGFLYQLTRFVYTALHSLFLPIIMLRLLWRSRSVEAYRHRWTERWGYIERIPKQAGSIWIHAVSLGEVNAAIPLIKKLCKRYPNHAIVVTTSTLTGSNQVSRLLKDQVWHFYAPYDISGFVQRFLRRTRTKLCIIMETEIWPNILHCCRMQNIPVFLANARFSEKALLRYQTIQFFMRPVLESYTMVAAQDILDGERLLSLGLPPENLMISGNIKFDIQLSPNIQQEGKALRTKWQSIERPIFIAASTHDEEEAIVIEAFILLKEKLPTLLLILVPRHPERFSKIEQLLCSRGLTYALRSLNQSPVRETEVLLGDTIGELLLLYASSDVAFVGGSLVPTGGHNLVEPAILGLPVLTGPHLYNFKEISSLLQAVGAAQIIQDAKSLALAVYTLFSAQDLRKTMGRRAKETVQTNTGALHKHMQWIEHNFPIQSKLYRPEDCKKHVL